MTSSLTRLWISAVHHAAFRCGGWAVVRAAGGQVSGLAGGERNTTARRMALAGLAAGLRDLPAGAGVVSVRTANPDLLSLAGPLSGAPTDAEADLGEDQGLWTQILAAAKGRRIELVRAPDQPNTPIAFAAAWADFAMDKAKAKGAFAAAIPKPNLAKLSLGEG